MSWTFYKHPVYYGAPSWDAIKSYLLVTIKSVMLQIPFSLPSILQNHQSPQNKPQSINYVEMTFLVYRSEISELESNYAFTQVPLTLWVQLFPDFLETYIWDFEYLLVFFHCFNGWTSAWETGGFRLFKSSMPIWCFVDTFKILYDPWHWTMMKWKVA